MADSPKKTNGEDDLLACVSRLEADLQEIEKARKQQALIVRVGVLLILFAILLFRLLSFGDAGYLAGFFSLFYLSLLTGRLAELFNGHFAPQFFKFIETARIFLEYMGYNISVIKEDPKGLALSLDMPDARALIL